MFIEYVTALVITYSFTVDGVNKIVHSAIWFKNEADCQEAFQHNKKVSKSVDNLYAHLHDVYGNDIMMSCEKTDIISTPFNFPPPRPRIFEEVERNRRFL